MSCDEMEFHANQQLYIEHKKLFAVQVLPENLPRIFNMFREWSLNYFIPHPSEKHLVTKLTMADLDRKIVVEALDYLVWGPGVEVHAVRADVFNDIYNVKEALQ